MAITFCAFPFRLEPVSRLGARKLKFAEQRLAPANCRVVIEILKIPGQRRVCLSLSRGNIGSSHKPGTHDAETALRGWHVGFEPSLPESVPYRGLRGSPLGQ